MVKPIRKSATCAKRINSPFDLDKMGITCIDNRITIPQAAHVRRLATTPNKQYLV